MFKMPKISLILLVLFFISTGLINCAGNKSNPGSSSDEMPGEGSSIEAAPIASPEVDEAKQAAESAAFEAHRLREELNRKKKQSN